MPNGAVRLAVPYAEKDRFKQKYGRQFLWNPQGKFWYWFSEAALPDEAVLNQVRRAAVFGDENFVIVGVVSACLEACGNQRLWEAT